MPGLPKVTGSRTRRLLGVAAARRRLRRLMHQSTAGDLREIRSIASSTVAVLRAEMGRPAGSTVLEVAIALNTLADLHVAAVALQPATDTLDEALRLLEQAPASSDVVAVRSDTLVRRGGVHRRQARWPEARADLDLALTVAPDPLRRAGAVNALGILAKDTGCLGQAQVAYAEAYQLLATAHGADAPALAGLEHNLAGLCHARGQHALGEPHIRRALTLRTACPGRAWPGDVFGDQAVLVALLAGQCRYDEAEPLARDLIEAWTQLRGPDHYEVGHARDHLASILTNLGQAAAAADQYRQALQIYQAHLGPDHPEAVAVRDALLTLRPGG